MGGQQGNWRSQRFVCYCNTSSGDAVTLRMGVYIPRGWIVVMVRIRWMKIIVILANEDEEVEEWDDDDDDDDYNYWLIYILQCMLMMMMMTKCEIVMVPSIWFAIDHIVTYNVFFVFSTQDLSDNRLGSVGASAVSEMLLQNSTLTHVTLSGMYTRPWFRDFPSYCHKLWCVTSLWYCLHWCL